MPVLGLSVTFIGYTLSYYALTQLQGGNWGLLDLLLPTRWPAAASVPRDGGGKISKAATPGPTQLKAKP